MKVTEKGIAEENLTDPYDHFLCEGECLKLTRSRNLNNKQFQTLPTNVIISPDEIYDTYVNIDDNMQLNVNIYNSLISKAKQWLILL